MQHCNRWIMWGGGATLQHCMGVLGGGLQHCSTAWGCCGGGDAALPQCVGMVWWGCNTASPRVYGLLCFPHCSTAFGSFVGVTALQHRAECTQCSTA